MNKAKWLQFRLNVSRCLCDDDHGGQSGWMFAQMQTPIPWISVASRHVVDGAGRRDLRSVANVLPLATW
jgi:hypothetical protein